MDRILLAEKLAFDAAITILFTLAGKLTSLAADISIGVEIDVGVIVVIAFESIVTIGVFGVATTDPVNVFEFLLMIFWSSIDRIRYSERKKCVRQFRIDNNSVRRKRCEKRERNRKRKEKRISLDLNNEFWMGFTVRYVLVLNSTTFKLCLKQNKSSKKKEF